MNLRRADLNLNNIKSKSVCSVHFEPSAYNCPTDIASSRLLPTAVPTLVECPNPPKPFTSPRPPPKKRKIEHTPVQPVQPEELPTLSPEDSSHTADVQGDKIKELENKLRMQTEAHKKEIQEYQTKQKRLNRQLKRLKSSNAKISDELKSVYEKLEKARKKILSSFLINYHPYHPLSY